MTTQPMDTNPVQDLVETKPDPNAELRAYADRMKAENAALRQQAIQGHLASIGLQPDKGLGKAIAKEYEGEITAEAVTAYAHDEYGYEVAAGSEQAAQDLQAQQDRIETLQGESAPVTPQSRLDKIAQHDETLAQPEATRADAVAAINDKLEQYLQDTR